MHSLSGAAQGQVGSFLCASVLPVAFKQPPQLTQSRPLLSPKRHQAEVGRHVCTNNLLLWIGYASACLVASRALLGCFGPSHLPRQRSSAELAQQPKGVQQSARGRLDCTKHAPGPHCLVQARYLQGTGTKQVLGHACNRVCFLVKGTQRADRVRSDFSAQFWCAEPAELKCLLSISLEHGSTGTRRCVSLPCLCSTGTRPSPQLLCRHGLPSSTRPKVCAAHQPDTLPKNSPLL